MQSPAEAHNSLADFRKFVGANREKRSKLLQPNYTSPVWVATAQAICLGLERLTCIEFGVAQGRGFNSLIEICKDVTEATGIAFDILGFDTLTGMPPSTDFRDHPELWQEGDYATLRRDELLAALPSHARIIEGNVRDTVVEFMKGDALHRAPLGFVSIDLDYWSSTGDALGILLGDAEAYLPATAMYFDDIDGLVTLNQWAGEELAIEQFNARSANRKIQRKVTRSPKSFICHVLDHPVRTGRTRPVIPLHIPVSIFS